MRDSRLDASAQIKADDMVAKNYFAHDDPTTGKNIAWSNPVFRQLCVSSSENINQIGGIGDYNATAVNSWMNSKAHHDAILASRYTLTGVAINGDKVVQHFCVSK